MNPVPHITKNADKEKTMGINARHDRYTRPGSILQLVQR